MATKILTVSRPQSANTTKPQPTTATASPSSSAPPTGTNDLIDACVAKGLRTPEFVQDEDFCTIIWRKVASSPQTVQRIISRLKALGLVHRIGGDKGGHWAGSE